MRTILYIDGYNLYYGLLKNSPYKWLDICRLFTRLLHEQNPSNNLLKVVYFTAPAKANMASHGAASAQAQQTYHQALQHLYKEQLDIQLGRHSVQALPLPAYQKGEPCNKQVKQWVWLMEEKETDVNIAIQMYRDGIKSHCDQVVLCSNDSDLSPAIKAIAEDLPHIKLGVILPIPLHSQNRRPSHALTTYANWVRKGIASKELEEAQLPKLIPTHKKPIRKPPHW